MWEKILQGIYELLKNNIAVIVALLIVYLNNRHNLKIKEKELSNDLRKIEKNLESDLKFSIKKDKSDYEKVVHASLIKILFEVQKLHISLSGKCDDYKCVENATNGFIVTFTKYQAIIADSQLFLSSSITNKLYEFYKLLSELLIELKNVQSSKQYELAIVPVNEYSVKLANVIIVIQNEFKDKRDDLEKEINSISLTNFTECCGAQPPDHLRERYYKLKNELRNAYNPDDLKLDIKN
ncbi:MAG: hypothetical protein EPN82_08465 [Bacteroidetes bacterium]|nr:MAG: hypothetical protein EPN82_08465 [Bacteroidota bacterium]